MPSATPDTNAARLLALPKAEVHLHLEGYFEVNPTHWHAWRGRLPAMLDAMDAATELVRPA